LYTNNYTPLVPFTLDLSVPCTNQITRPKGEVGPRYRRTEMHVLSPDPLDGTLVRHRIHPLLDSETIGNSRHFYSQSGFDKYIYSISRKYKNASSDCLMQIAGEEERGVGYCEVGHIDGEAAMGITDGNGGRATREVWRREVRPAGWGTRCVAQEIPLMERESAQVHAVQVYRNTHSYLAWATGRKTLINRPIPGAHVPWN